jgi:hypothetical protein
MIFWANEADWARVVSIENYDLLELSTPTVSS